MATVLKVQSLRKKQVHSPGKLIFHFRKRNITTSKPDNHPRPPQMRCFTDEEIMNATNFFHPDNKWTHHAMIPIEGRFGYLAPEYFVHGIVGKKTGVFSFGVFLLKIVRDHRFEKAESPSLGNAALGIASLVEPKVKGQYDSQQLHRVVVRASHCLLQSLTWRPAMSTVKELLVNGKDARGEG